MICFELTLNIFNGFHFDLNLSFHFQILLLEDSSFLIKGRILVDRKSIKAGLRLWSDGRLDYFLQCLMIDVKPIRVHNFNIAGFGILYFSFSFMILLVHHSLLVAYDLEPGSECLNYKVIYFRRWRYSWLIECWATDYCRRRIAFAQESY